MLEGDRSRLYDWLCEETDERLAEYLVSRLSTVPLDELATKNDLRRLETTTKNEIQRLETTTKNDLQRVESELRRVDTAVVRLVDLRETDRAEAAALREADRAEAAALREADGAERAADRAEAKSQFRWLVGIFVSFGVSILAVVGTPMAVSLISG